MFLQIANAYMRVYEAIDAKSSLKFDIRLSIYRQQQLIPYDTCIQNCLKLDKNVAGFCVEFLNGVLAILTLSIKYNFSISIWKCIILLGVNSLNKHDLRCHICKICWLRMSIGRRKDEKESEKTKKTIRRKDESEKTKRRKRKDEKSEKTKRRKRKDEKTKAKRRKDESEKTKRRKRKDKKTKAKRRKRKDESDKTKRRKDESEKRKDEKTKAKRRKDEKTKAKRRKDESEKTKRRKRKDESEKTKRRKKRKDAK